MPLLPYYSIDSQCESGLDEAGRGCLCGDVFAAAVILPRDFKDPLLRDSKTLSERQRNQLREIILRESIDWAVGRATSQEIDEINILRASILAMHRAVDGLSVRPDLLIVDGNRFTPYHNIPHQTIVKGDNKYYAIAAASILAKTYRDDYMYEMATLYPQYDLMSNKGYPTQRHRDAIDIFGLSPIHRRSFGQKSKKK